jgi:hypothetical protein
MKTFGIRIKFLVFVFVLFCTEKVWCQVKCSPPIDDACDDKCGGVSIGLSTDTNSFFCQGQIVSLQIDKLKTSDFDSFYVYWCDGFTDSYGPDLKTLTHTYDISEDDICKRRETKYYIWVVGKKICDEGASCREIGVDLKIRHKPRAIFDYTNSVCINNKVDFINLSCNVDEIMSDAYLWTFHDGMTSTSKNASKIYTSPGTYTVKLKVKNGCGEHEITQIITVVDYPDAVVNISATARDSIVCIGDTITLINKSNQWSNTNWIFLGTNNVPVNVLTDTTRWKLDKKIRNLEKRLPIDTIIYLDTIKFVVLEKTVSNRPLKFLLKSMNACDTVYWTWNLKVVDSTHNNLRRTFN